MQAQECFNQPRPALPPIRLPPLSLLAGDVGSATGSFSGGAADSAAGAGGGAGTAAAASAGARCRWRWCRQSVLAWDHGWVGHGSSLGDELAGHTHTSFIENSIEAGNLLRGNDALHAMLGARTRARMQSALVTMMSTCLIARLLN